MIAKVMRGRLAAVLLLGCACVVERRPPPPPPRLLTAREAVDASAYFARARGIVVDHTVAARLDRRARWHVDLAGAGGRDRALVVLDGYSGRVLNARLRGPRGDVATPGAPPPPPGEAVPQGAPPEAAPPGGPPAGGAPPPPPPGDDGPNGDLPPVPPPLPRGM